MMAPPLDVAIKFSATYEWTGGRYRRYLETSYISFKYQCLHKRVGHITYKKLHFPKIRKKLFFLFHAWLHVSYIMQSVILSTVYVMTFFCQMTYFEQKRL
jgi:hypothetical protein